MDNVYIEQPPQNLSDPGPSFDSKIPEYKLNAKHYLE
jgi:hypothetical protein